MVERYAGPREKSMETQLTKTLTSLVQTALHPRMLVQVVVQVVHEDGSLLAAALNASIAALLDASIPLHSLLCVASVARLPDGATLTDPTSKEELVRSPYQYFCFRKYVNYLRDTCIDLISF